MPPLLTLLLVHFESRKDTRCQMAQVLTAPHSSLFPHTLLWHNKKVTIGVCQAGVLHALIAGVHVDCKAVLLRSTAPNNCEGSRGGEKGQKATGLMCALVPTIHTHLPLPHMVNRPRMKSTGSLGMGNGRQRSWLGVIMPREKSACRQQTNKRKSAGGP